MVKPHLTQIDAQQIILDFVAGSTSEEIAKKFKISQSNVGYIIQGKTWRNLKRLQKKSQRSN